MATPILPVLDDVAAVPEDVDDPKVDRELL
jgi:hypothetical protein